MYHGLPRRMESSGTIVSPGSMVQYAGNASERPDATDFTAGSPAAIEDTDTMTDQPNIIVVMPDQQRMDSLACYGNVFVQTPCVDELAADGVRFNRAFTPYPICTPARASMWTGAYPHAHEIVSNVYMEADAFRGRGAIKTTVFSLLKDAGYNTAYIGKWHLGDDNPGCFDYWDAFNSQGGHWVDGRQTFQGGTYLPDQQTDKAVDYIRSQRQATEPFVLVQGFYPPHQPYTAPADCLEQYRGKGIPNPGYYAHNTALDRNLGRMIEALDESGLRQRTLVLYFADHGDTFRYRDGLTNKIVCHDDAIRVPFVVSYPGGIESGSLVDADVGLQDVAPTMLDYAGAPIPDWVQGKSVRPWLEGTRPAEWRDCYYIQNDHRRHARLVDSTLPPGFRLFGPWKQRAIRDERWKLILSDGGKNFLYDLRDDPEEELEIFGAPRSDNQDQFRHYESHEDVIVEMAQRLADAALSLGDDVGVRLGEAVMRDPSIGRDYGPGDPL